MITAIGCGDSRPVVSPTVIEVLGEILAAKTEAEDHLMASGLDATILRPGGMTSDPASGTAIMSDDHSLMGVINRADLAALTVDCIDDDATIGKICTRWIRKSPGMRRCSAATSRCTASLERYALWRACRELTRLQLTRLRVDNKSLRVGCSITRTM